MLSKLDSPISSLSRINQLHADALKRLKLFTIQDLLYHFPTRYADSREVTATTNLESGKPVTLYGVMEKVQVRRSFRGHVPMTEAHIADHMKELRHLRIGGIYRVPFVQIERCVKPWLYT